MRLLLTTTALALIATSAMAADLGTVPLVKAPPPTPYYDWSGFYAGLNVGGGWGTNSSTLKTFLGNATDMSLSSEPSSGFIGGGQIGYNWQTGPVVLGVEASGEALGINGQGPCLVALTCKDSATWEADASARVGFAANHLLVYGKGGIAWANFDHDVVIPGLTTVSASETPAGALVGAGIEYAVMQHLTARFEYDFISFQDKTLDLHVPGIGNGGLNSVDYRKDLSLVKAGLNYKF